MKWHGTFEAIAAKATSHLIHSFNLAPLLRPTHHRRQLHLQRIRPGGSSAVPCTNADHNSAQRALRSSITTLQPCYAAPRQPIVIPPTHLSQVRSVPANEVGDLASSSSRSSLLDDVVVSGASDLVGWGALLLGGDDDTSASRVRVDGDGLVVDDGRVLWGNEREAKESAFGGSKLVGLRIDLQTSAVKSKRQR